MLCTNETFYDCLCCVDCFKGLRRLPCVPVKGNNTLVVESRSQSACKTYSNSVRAAELSLQTTFEFSGVSGLIGVVEVDQAADSTESSNESSNHGEARTGCCPGVFVRREHAEHIVVFVDGFTEVSTLLGIPPVGVGVAELTLNSGRVNVTTVLYNRKMLAFSFEPQPRMSRCFVVLSVTHHAGVFSSAELRRAGILFLQNLLIGIVGREEATALHNWCLSRSSEGIAQR